MTTFNDVNSTIFPVNLSPHKMGVNRIDICSLFAIRLKEDSILFDKMVLHWLELVPPLIIFHINQCHGCILVQNVVGVNSTKVGIFRINKDCIICILN